MTDKVAFVTGAGRGIGLEVCRQLAERGMTVVLTARDLEKARAAAEQLVMIASSPAAPGQAYALHNDDDQGGGSDDIALAQVDLATGALVQDVPVPGTGGYEVQSSPVLTEPDANGDAMLFFVASD